MVSSVKVVLVVVAVVAMAACSGGGGHAARVPAETAPAEIVRMYLAALDAHDITNAKELLSRSHAEEVDHYADSWFRNIDSINNISTTESGYPPGAHPPGQGYAQTAAVRAEFDLHQKKIGSFSDGPNSWGYILGRNSDSEHWVIISEGNG